MVSVSTTMKDGATIDTVNVVAKQSDKELASFLSRPNEENSNWVLKVQNSAGYELPASGGTGTIWLYLLGTGLLLGCGTILLLRRRRARV